MTSPALAAFSQISDTGPGTTLIGKAVRQRCELLRGQLEAERGTFLSQWKILGSYILPRRPRFSVSDVNKGGQRDQNIIDSTATQAVGTLAAGMMSGLTSPARPWFLLETGDSDLDEQEDVKAWLYEVQQRMETIFLKSNLYTKLPILYKDMATFGTGVLFVMEDDRDVIRLYDFPPGSYMLANDDRQQVNTFVRPFRLTVQQVVQRWGQVDAQGLADFQRKEPSTLSQQTQNLWNRNTRAAWIDLVHVVQPNVSYDGEKIDAKYKRFEDIYYEIGAPLGQGGPQELGLLAHSGFDEFPGLCGRWEVSAEDVYGTNCPGMACIGDIKQLQMGEKRSLQAVEKALNPPLTGPSALMTTKVSTLPGDITYHDARDAATGIRPIYQVNFNIQQLEEKQQQVRDRIKRGFYADLFLMLEGMDKGQVTATEILEKKDEKLQALGPVYWQFNPDVADPLINRTFNIMARKQLLPPPPDALRGVQLQVRYISIVSQAQKSTGVTTLERFAAFVGQIAQTAPEILDQIDDNELMQHYADATGIPPKILRSQDAVAQIRQARQQAQQQQQAAENAPGIAGAAKDLSQVNTTGNNALSALLGKVRARATVNATAQPPASVQ